MLWGLSVYLRLFFCFLASISGIVNRCLLLVTRRSKLMFDDAQRQCRRV